jgi:ATP-dependent exoDNAse (exonuclease V) beta subunit
MAVLYRHRDVMAQITDTLRREGIPFECPQLTKRFVPSADSVKVVTMHSSKGLEFPLVCIPAIGAPPKNESTEEEGSPALRGYDPGNPTACDDTRIGLPVLQ